MAKCAVDDKNVASLERGFRFKQFFVADGQCGMKVGTDGILLGAWAQLPDDGAVLDIGAGSGLIALMLAQRSAGRLPITAVELDAAASGQAASNVAASPWPGAVDIQHSCIGDFQPGRRFQLIVANPPYFVHGQAFADPRRARARHTGSLDFPTLLDAAGRLLADDGQFSLVLPYEQGQAFIELAKPLGWHCQRQCRVKTTPRKGYHRLLFTLVREATDCEVEELTVHGPDGGYSDDYIGLTRDFYLKM